MEVSLSEYTTGLVTAWLENGSEPSDADRWLAERARDARHDGGKFWWVDVDHDDALTLIEAIDARLDDIEWFVDVEPHLKATYADEHNHLRFDKELLKGVV